jgi:hypothetical protein
MRRILLSALLATTLAACGSDDPEFGRLSLGVTDAPVDTAERVVVEFSGVTIQPAEGEREEFMFDTPRQIDLLALQGGAEAMLLTNESLPAGRYNWIRLHVNASQNESTSFIEYEDGTQYPLFIPSGNQTGLQLVQGFDVPVNGSISLTIDFDLRRSVIRPPGMEPNHILRPALRLVDNSEVGSIAGVVDASLIVDDGDHECSPAVYVYEGSGVEPTDVFNNAGPVTTAIVNMDSEGVFSYRAAFLVAGDYTAAFTCEADLDDPDTDDEIVFTGGAADVEVVAGDEAAVNFPQD